MRGCDRWISVFLAAGRGPSSHSFFALLLYMLGFQRARLPVLWSVVTNKQVMCKSFGFKEKYVSG